MSFLKLEAQHRVKDSKIMQLCCLINWSRLVCILEKLSRSGYGPQGYDVLQLLKGLVLQSWYSLSDPKLEEALNVRLDFMLFTGFEYDVPDATTFCRFRNKLVELGLLEKIFSDINDQLIEQGLAVCPANSAIIDATIIKSAARPSKETVGIVFDREEDECRDVVLGDMQLSKDPDTRWLKKGSKSYYGYKAFIATDSNNGFIRNVDVMPANVSEVKNLSAALGSLRPRRVYADKGYASLENRDLLKTHGIKNGLMYKAVRNNPLSRWEKLFNRIVSKQRYLVEQAFGTLKRVLKMTRATYMTLPKVKADMILKAIAFNLLKAVNIRAKTVI